MVLLSPSPAGVGTSQSLLGNAHFLKSEDFTQQGLCFSAITSTMVSPGQEKQAQRSKRRPAGLDLSSSFRTEHGPTMEGLGDNSTVNSPKRQRRTSDSPKDCRYYCTSCSDSFSNKIAWKTHEDQVHERRGKYPCPRPDCTAVFFDPDDFKRHHKETHSCGRCAHSQTAFQRLGDGTRGYGCGICAGFFASQDSFLEHVAEHWEARQSRRHWYQTRVIYGLLHRPGIQEAWLELLRATYPNRCVMPGFRWDEARTGRSSGHDSIGHGLQEALEMFGEIPGVTAADVVVMAHDLAVRVPRAELTRAYTMHEPTCHVYKFGMDMGRELRRSYSMDAQTGPGLPPTNAQPEQHHHHHHHQPTSQQQHLAGLPANTYAELERWKMTKGMNYLMPAPLLQQQQQQHPQHHQQLHDAMAMHPPNVHDIHQQYQQEPGQHQQLLSGLGVSVGALVPPQFQHQFTAPLPLQQQQQQQQQHGGHYTHNSGSISPSYVPVADSRGLAADSPRSSPAGHLLPLMTTQSPAYMPVPGPTGMGQVHF